MEGWTDIERLHIQSLSGKIFGENETIINPNETILSTQTNFNKFLTTKVINLFYILNIYVFLIYFLIFLYFFSVKVKKILLIILVYQLLHV